MLNRRAFLALAAPAALCATLPAKLDAQRGGGDVSSYAALAAYAQGLITQANLQRYAGTNFRVFLDDGALSELQLRSAKARKPQTLTPKQTVEVVNRTRSLYSNTRRVTSFIATFDLVGKPFPQDTYMLEHAVLGRFSVFLVQGGPALYHASFTAFEAEPSSTGAQ